MTKKEILEQVFRDYYVPLYSKDKPISEMTSTEQGMYKQTLIIGSLIFHAFDKYHTSLKFMPKVNGEYQCKHVKEDIIDGDCVWCALTVAEKGLDKQRELRMAEEKKVPSVGEILYSLEHTPYKILPGFIKITIPPRLRRRLAQAIYNLILKKQEGEKPINDIERCPNPECNSIYIQYDNIMDECYCLEKSCNNRWKEKLDFKNIKNDYLRASIWSSKKFK